MIADWENRKFNLTDMKLGFMVRDKENMANFVFFTVEEMEEMIKNYQKAKKELKK